jgi:hypothetical protein
VDFDGDGIPDLISGSYDPGEIYLFRGLGKGKFKARETLMDKSGKPILTHPDQKAKWESFGTWPALVDWDNDGDLDLVIGGYGGEIWVRINEGTRTKPVFATTNIRVQAGGKDLQVPGHHATPVIVDWDGDGLWDILSGSGDGGVYFFRNIGKLGAPQFAAPLVLIPPHKGTGYSEFVEDDAAIVPGIRSQIAVADFNGDGKLDLLVGDFCTHVSPRPGLAPAERKELLSIRAKLDEAEKAATKAYERISAAMQEFAKTFPKEDIVKPEVQEKLRKKQEELQKEPEFKKLSDAYEDLQKEQQRFLVKPKTKSPGDDYAVPHGYVWLYLRK